ncbi:Eukaryotic translation initiation factor 4 gamma 2 [Rhizophlyctis rosea]|nr:Eukaryotic translation initiation factor 4 gamma 2 [Rhizophlyctis rosea]
MKSGGKSNASGPAKPKIGFGSFSEPDAEKPADATPSDVSGTDAETGAAENTPTSPLHPTPVLAAAARAAALNPNIPRTMSAPPSLKQVNKPNFQTASKIAPSEGQPVQDAEAAPAQPTQSQEDAPAPATISTQPAASSPALPTSPVTSAAPASLPSAPYQHRLNHLSLDQTCILRTPTPTFLHNNIWRMAIINPTTSNTSNNVTEYDRKMGNKAGSRTSQEDISRTRDIRDTRGIMDRGIKAIKLPSPHVPGANQPQFPGMSQPAMAQQMPAVTGAMWQQPGYAAIQPMPYYPAQFDPQFQQYYAPYPYPGGMPYGNVPGMMVRPPPTPSTAQRYPQHQGAPHTAQAPTGNDFTPARRTSTAIKITNAQGEAVTFPTKQPATPSKPPATAAAPAPVEAPEVVKPVEPKRASTSVIIKNPNTGEIIGGVKAAQPVDVKDGQKAEGEAEAPAQEAKKEEAASKEEEVETEAKPAEVAEEKESVKEEAAAKGDVAEQKPVVEKKQKADESKPADSKPQPTALDTKAAVVEKAESVPSPTSPIKSPSKASAEPVSSKSAKKKKGKETPKQEEKEEATAEPVAKKEEAAEPTKVDAPVEKEVKVEEKAPEEPAKQEEAVTEKAEEPKKVKAEEAKEVPAEQKEEKKEVAEERPAEEAEVEEGEIVETKPVTEAEPVRRSESPVPDTSATLDEAAEAKPQKPAKLNIRTPVSMKRLESFEGVKYPSTIESPTVVKGGPFKYKRDFLMSFMDVAKERPQGLPSPAEIYGDGDRVSSPGGKRGSQGPGARTGMQRQGSHSDVSRSGPMPKSSDERFSESMKSRLHGGVMGVIGGIPTVAAPPGRMQRGGSGGGGMPTIQRQGSGAGYNRAGGQRDGRDSRSGRGSRREPPAPQPQTPLEPVEPLQKSDKGWKPASITKVGAPVKAREGMTEEEAAEIETIERKTKGLLNKLTIEKFGPISDQILHVGMKNQNLLKTVIELIFEKAIDEPNFGSMYAQLCAKLSTDLPKVEEWVDIDARNNVFRRALLNKCQEEFEKGEKWSVEESESLDERREKRKHLESLSAEEKLKIAEEDYQRGKLKRRVLGNMAFIGELFIKTMLSEKIMHACILQLLRNVQDPEEEDIESLCKLMTTVGSRLDHPKAVAHMDSYFKRIGELSTNKKLSSRIRFMLMDLIDLRKEEWKSRNAAAGPKTIAEIHAEAERKAAEEAERIKQANRSSGGSRGGLPTRDQQFGGRGDRRGPGGRQGPGGGQGQSGPDGWTSVQGGRSGSAAASRQAGDITKFGQLKSMSAGQMTFGPGGGAGFGFGAKGWGSAAKKEEESKKGPSLSRSGSAGSTSGGFSNAFALLGTEEGGVDVRKKSIDEGRKSTASTASEAKAAPAPAEAPKKLSKKQAENKISSMISEWFGLHDVQEVIATIKELGSEEYHDQVVNDFISKVFDQKQAEVEKVADLLAKLAEEKIIASDVYKKTLADQYEFVDDVAYDVPNAHLYIGVISARLISSDVLTIEDVLELSQPIISAKTLPAPKILGGILQNIKSVDGQDRLVEIWNSWKDTVDVREFWPADKRGDEALAEWLEGKGLLVLEPHLEHVKGLKWRLGKDDADAIIAWLDETVSESLRSDPSFVRTVTTCVLRHVASQTVFPNGPQQPAVEVTADVYNKQKDLLTASKPILIKYATDADKKVEVLFGAQAYCAEVGFPKELLQSLFRLFYELEIVDEPAFNAWRDDSKRGGPSKKEAVKALQGWFKYLADQQ